MAGIQDSFYAQWRVHCGAVPLLRDDQDSPPERLLQAIWQHQRLRRDQLVTLDGQPVRVLHPGFRNLEGGPDFRAAMVQVGDAPARLGDIEVDVRSSGWRAHGHDINPAFKNVILHVIWESGGTMIATPPLVQLRQALDAPLGELSLWLGGETAQTFPEALRGNCCAPLRGLSTAELIELLHQAAGVRLRAKGAQFQARARQAGWEQSLWEGLFRALGFKHNVWPMQRLAELRPHWLGEYVPATRCAARGQPVSQEAGAVPSGITPEFKLILQARLLGLSGLLPTDITRGENATDSYLRQVWDQWWRERDTFAGDILPRAVWHLHGLRPANHPQRRLALAAAWSLADHLPAKIEQWCAKEMPDSALPNSLLQALEVEPDAFWSWHWTLRSPWLKKPVPLLGATRLTDVAVNVVLPWLWIRAVEGKSEAVRQRLERRYFAWPAADDNSVLQLARQRLLGGAARRLLPGAAAQQGLIQMIRDFCDHSDSICQACKLPALVGEFQKASQTRLVTA